MRIANGAAGARQCDARVPSLRTSNGLASLAGRRAQVALVVAAAVVVVIVPAAAAKVHAAAAKVHAAAAHVHAVAAHVHGVVRACFEFSHMAMRATFVCGLRENKIFTAVSELVSAEFV